MPGVQSMMLAMGIYIISAAATATSGLDAALPFAYVTPVFTRWFAFANSSGSDDRPYTRDPTTALFDPVTSSWHLYTTAMHLHGGGYPGAIRHFALNNSSLAEGPATGRVWSDEGIVLQPSGQDGRFDASGVFTPGAVRECDAAGKACKWFLFFGGVENQNSSHSEMVGVSSADSPWGPFTRDPANPVFSYEDKNSAWCGVGNAARVDEIKPVVNNKTKFLVVKSVCKNFTALPVLYSPRDQSSWGPPYEITTSAPSPLFTADKTCRQLGFEEPTLFTAPDGYLHFIGHNHGSSGCPGKYAHFISRGHDIGHWQEAPMFGGKFMEPNPIPAAGDGVFGGKIMEQWIDFDVSSSLIFLNASWQSTRLHVHNGSVP